MKNFSVLVATIFVIALSFFTSTAQSYAAGKTSPGSVGGCFTGISSQTNVIANCGSTGRNGDAHHSKSVEKAPIVSQPVVPPSVNHSHHRFYVPVHYRYHPHYHFHQHPHFYFSWFHRSSFGGLRGHGFNARTQSHRHHH